MSKNKFALGAVVGTAFGAIGGFVAGILTAPKSGKETREDVKRETQKVVDAAEKQVKKVAKNAKTEGKKAAQVIKDKLDKITK
jgi:gas vesicle protein